MIKNPENYSIEDYKNFMYNKNDATKQEREKLINYYSYYENLILGINANQDIIDFFELNCDWKHPIKEITANLTNYAKMVYNYPDAIEPNIWKYLKEFLPPDKKAKIETYLKN